MHQSTFRQTYIVGAILTTLLFGLLGFGYAFGANLTCTNQFSCTMDVCPAVCDRPTVGFGITVVGQLALFGWLVAAANGRIPAPAWSVVAAANLSVLVLAISALVSMSWR